MTLEQINAENRKPENMKVFRQMLGAVQQVKAFQSATVGGATGFLAVLEAKPEPAKGKPELLEHRTMMLILETPKGLTTAVCAAKKRNFPARQKEFEAVLRSVVAPR